LYLPAVPGRISITPPSPSDFWGLRHEVQSVSDMRRTDARSRDTGSPKAVTFSFHVILNKIEPSVFNRAFNLFAKNNVRLALLDKFEPDGPQVTLVVDAFAGACNTEGLAGATTCPNRSVV
jgi:hypothetical protein